MRPAYKVLCVCVVLGSLILGCNTRTESTVSSTGATAKMNPILPKRGDQKAP